MVIISSGKEGQGLGPSSAFIPLTSREGASVQKKLEKHFPPDGDEVNKIALEYLFGGGYGISISCSVFHSGMFCPWWHGMSAYSGIFPADDMAGGPCASVPIQERP